MVIIERTARLLRFPGWMMSAFSPYGSRRPVCGLLCCLAVVVFTTRLAASMVWGRSELTFGMMSGFTWWPYFKSVALEEIDLTIFADMIVAAGILAVAGYWRTRREAQLTHWLAWAVLVDAVWYLATWCVTMPYGGGRHDVGEVLRFAFFGEFCSAGVLALSWTIIRRTRWAFRTPDDQMPAEPAFYPT
jgi:hypothetical protein